MGRGLRPPPPEAKKRYPMTNNNTKIDLGNFESIAELHKALAQQLRFPDYYGNNWDAFWDCISDAEQSSIPEVLHFTNFKVFKARFPGDANILSKCVKDFQNERKDVRIILR